MGIFDIFSKYNKVEKALLDLYTQLNTDLLGMSHQEAKHTANTVLDHCIEESRKEGTYDFPQDLGDIIIGIEKADNPKIKAFSDLIRQSIGDLKKEGVRNEDIQWWWNLNDIERRIMIAYDKTTQIMIYRAFIDDGLSELDASEKVLESNVRYGYPDSTSYFEGDNRPLPYELKERINLFVSNRRNGDYNAFIKEVLTFPSFNAFIRSEIRKGNI